VIPVTPNILAWLVLILWGPITIALFARFRPPIATALCLIGGVLFLPQKVDFDLPVLPPFDKFTITNVWTLIGCLWKCRGQLASARVGSGVDRLVWLFLIGAFGTTLTNREILVFGPTTLESLSIYDSIALFGKDILTIGIPFFLGRAVFSSAQAGRDFLRVMVLGGIFYSFLCLLEIRLSPQLHNWIYGFHQHSFAQTIRFGGYRPTVFMDHGLAVAMFMLGTALAAMGLWRARSDIFGLPVVGTFLWLTFVFVVCKSMGATIYLLLVAPLLLFMSTSWTKRLAYVLAWFVFLFPVLRGSDTIPTAEIVELFAKINEDRASSLEDRFEQEDELLARARERIVFGWGTYGRNRVWDEKTGKDLSVTDGDWMIKLGSRGIVGFVGCYGLLLMPIFMAARSFGRIRRAGDQWLIATMMIIAALFAVDLLPNGQYSYFPYLFSGTLAGLSSGILRAQSVRLARARLVRKQRAAAALRQPTEPTAVGA
jgi:hypothetical protein